MNEWLRYERSLMVKEETGRSTYVGVDNPPSICFFTALNTDGGVASCDVSDDSLIVALGRPVWDVRFCSRGYYYCTGGADKTATVWSTDRVHPLRIFPDCYGHVTCIDYHPNCNYIAGGSDDRYVRLWDVLTGTCVRAFGGHKAGIRGIKISPCGRYIVTPTPPRGGNSRIPLHHGHNFLHTRR
ncbi:unnamed protein product, partial [Mesorhabditis spiculigera]